MAFILQEIAKPIAIAMRDIPFTDNWPDLVDLSVAELWTSNPVFRAIVQAQSQFMDDLIEAYSMTTQPGPIQPTAEEAHV
jgi:hypothetical protein